MGEEATLDEFAATSDIEDKPAEQPESRFWGAIPEGWELVNGSDVYDVNPNPKPDGEPNTYIEMDALDTELPWPRYFGERDASEYSGKTFSAGDTLFARITPCTENGKAALVPEIETEVGIGSTEFAVLSPKRSSINPWFLYYLGKSHPIHNYAVSRMRGSTGRQRVPFDVFRRELDIALPPFEEQRKIATVLYTVDQAIQKTEEIIEQVDRVQEGFTNHLFTSGPRDSKSVSQRLGPVATELPEHWETARIGELYAERQLGTSERGSSEDGKRIDLIKMGNLGFGTWDFSEVEKIDRDSELLDKLSLRRGDLLFNTRNTPELVGKTAVWEFDHDAIYDNNLLRLRFDERISSGSFVNYYLSSELGRRQLRGRVHGTTSVAAIYWTDLQQVEIPVPPKQEQEEIVDTLTDLDETRRRNKTYSDRLQRLKQGLMQDLLSGAVRTHEAAIPDETYNRSRRDGVRRRPPHGP